MKFAANAKKAVSIEQQCERAAGLRAGGLSYAEIGALMNVSAIRARDMVHKHARHIERTKAPDGSAALSQRAMLHLMVGKYGAAFAGNLETRLHKMSDIAAAYTWDELLAEEGIGIKTAWAIRLWLEAQGRTLRPPDALQLAVTDPIRPERRTPRRFVGHRWNRYTPSGTRQQRWA